MLWEGHHAEHWRRTWSAGAVHLFESVGSTNDVLAQLAAEGAPHFTVVLAEEQTRGRGRGGSRWQAKRGSSLLFSILFRIASKSGAPGTAPIRIGIAVAEAIQDAKLKWPNDVVIPPCGKVAGILCEGTFGSHVIAGIGINVSQAAHDFPPELRAQACSVAGAQGRTIERAGLLTELMRRLAAIAPDLGEPLTPPELTRLAALDVLRGQHVVSEGTEAEKAEGIARGIAEDGALLIEQANGVRRLYTGTVRLAMERAYPGSVSTL